MPVEIKGKQLRIRVEPKRKFKKFRVHDVGRKGFTQRVAGFTGRKWKTQSWRFYIRGKRRFKTRGELLRAVNSVLIRQPKRKKRKILQRVKKLI